MVRSSGPLWFTTRAVLARPDGTRVEWSARRHRKGLGVRPLDGRRLEAAERRWGGRPRASAWWMGALFAGGSLCFALGSVPPYFEDVDARTVALTFFVGSLAFTAAAAIQYHEAATAPEGVLAGAHRRRGLRRLLLGRPAAWTGGPRACSWRARCCST